MSNEIRVDISKIPNSKCECGGSLWNKYNVVKIVPGILMGKSQPETVLLEALFCKECNKVFPQHEHMVKEPVSTPVS